LGFEKFPQINVLVLQNQGYSVLWAIDD
jgi:hypothetical protein